MTVSRRAFLMGCATLATAAAAVHAQPVQKPPRIGVLGSASGASAQEIARALRTIGWIEAQTITIEWRLVRTYDEMARAAQDLVQLGVDVIVCTNGPATQAAKSAPQKIPIVMAPAGDPVAAGLVASLANPGGNVTGLAIMHTELSGKRLELLIEAVPATRRVAALSNPRNPSVPAMVQETETRARSLGLDLVKFEASTTAELAGAFAAIAEQKIRGIVVLGDPFFFAESPRIVALALRHRLPGVFEWGEMAEQGGLLAYGPRLDALRRRAAVYVDRILKGAKPGDLAVEQPTTFELTVNLKTAKALGLTLPPSLVLRADRLIE